MQTRSRALFGAEELRSARIEAALSEGVRVYGRRVHILGSSTLCVRGGAEAAPTRMKVATFVDIGPRVVVAARRGPHGMRDVELARELLDDIPAGCLVLLDERFEEIDFLAAVRRCASDFIVEVSGATRTTAVHRLGRWDHHVDTAIRPPAAGLPCRWRLRLVTARLGRRTPTRLLTSILDPAIASDEIITLHRERVADPFANVVAVAGRTPAAVRSELAGLLRRYNGERSREPDCGGMCDMPSRSAEVALAA